LQIEIRTHENCALNLVLIAVKMLTRAGMVDECQWMGFISQMLWKIISLALAALRYGSYYQTAKLESLQQK